VPTQLLTCRTGYSSSSDYLFSYIKLKGKKALRKKLLSAILGVIATTFLNDSCNHYYYVQLIEVLPITNY
jgi:hypothetical protein